MNLMKKRKIGLMMGASLLLAGAGIAVAMTTTSCSKKSGLTFENLTATKTSDTDFNKYELSVKIDGFNSEKWKSVFIFTTIDNVKPSYNTLPSLSWYVKTEGTTQIDSTTPTGLAIWTNGKTTTLSAAAFKGTAPEVDKPINFGTVWTYFIDEDGNYSDTIYNEGDLTFTVTESSQTA